jgi:hypothetical protein
LPLEPLPEEDRDGVHDDQEAEQHKDASDVRATKPRSGLSAQRNICVGSAVDASMTPLGALVMKAFMPMSSSGAVSPSAWARTDDRARQDARHGQRHHVVRIT